MKYAFYTLLTFFLFACSQENPAKHPSNTGRLSYSTTSDSARHYYDLGWQQIMNEGRYGQSEVSYRKALEFDPGFLLAQATLARLSLDREERLSLYDSMTVHRDKLPADERLVFDTYYNFVHFTNLRDKDPAAAREFLLPVLGKAEANLSTIVHRYPEEPYLKCEYLEIINSNQGPEAAIDSFKVLTANRHADNHFLLGFAASLYAETGNFDEALVRQD
jgi:tetratricopeptide (TPR) repeat protein